MPHQTVVRIDLAAPVNPLPDLFNGHQPQVLAWFRIHLDGRRTEIIFSESHSSV